MRTSFVRHAALAAAALAAFITLGAGPATAQAQDDQHFGVQSNQGSRDAAAAPAAAPASPAAPAPATAVETRSADRSVPTQTGSALPVTGSDVAVITAVGLGLVASGFVVKRRATS